MTTDSPGLKPAWLGVAVAWPALLAAHTSERLMSTFRASSGLLCPSASGHVLPMLRSPGRPLGISGPLAEDGSWTAAHRLVGGSAAGTACRSARAAIPGATRHEPGACRQGSSCGTCYPLRPGLTSGVKQRTALPPGSRIFCIATFDPDKPRERPSHTSRCTAESRREPLG